MGKKQALTSLMGSDRKIDPVGKKWKSRNYVLVLRYARKNY